MVNVRVDGSLDLFSQDPGYGTWAMYLHKASLPNQPAKKGPTSLSRPVSLWLSCSLVNASSCTVLLRYHTRERISSFAAGLESAHFAGNGHSCNCIATRRNSSSDSSSSVPLYLGPHRCKLQTRTATAPFPPLLRSSRTAASKSTPTASEA
jgi:hypothetical protein